MAWTSLADRLDSLPLIICGPILRRVESDNVTVWVALKEEADVELEILNTTSNPLFKSSKQRTVKLGINLHVIAVTVDNMDLSPDTLYQYNLGFYSMSGSFKGDFKGQNIVTEDGNTNSISYHEKGFTLPTFCLPPSDINNLRILHGSCRKPHGQGFDALSITDSLILSDAENPSKRPQQLFLTGDQIYADDVAQMLLYFIQDANQTLLGWN